MTMSNVSTIFMCKEAIWLTKFLFTPLTPQPQLVA